MTVLASVSVIPYPPVCVFPIKKRIGFNLVFEIMLRVILFLISVIIIFLGLYLESIT